MKSLIPALLLIAGQWSFALTDFKEACQVPKDVRVSERNYAENMVLLKAMDGSSQCWLATFTLQDGAIDQIFCQKLARCDQSKN